MREDSKWPGGMSIGVVFYMCFLFFFFEFTQDAMWAIEWVQRVYRPPVWAIWVRRLGRD